MARPGRSRTPLIITLSVVLVLALLGVGAYFLWPRGSGSTATPKTSGALATTTAAPVVDPPVVVPAGRVQPLAPTAGKAPVAAKVTARLAGPLANPALADYTGVVLDPVSGATLWKKNPGNPVLPASTIKLLTGAALLTSMDPNTRLVTRVVAGEQPGDIVFVGGGDPTLSAAAAGVTSVYTGAPSVADLAAQVKATGVPVRRILLDTSLWSGDELAPGWQQGDITGTPASAQGFITRMQALMVDGDRADPGKDTSVRTGQPALNAGRALARALGAPNLPIVPKSTAPPKAKVLAQVQSQPVSILLSQALLSSDNVLAEALGRAVAIRRGTSATFDGMVAAVSQSLEDLKLDVTGLVMVDASGMSDQDRVTTGLLAQTMALAVGGKVPALAPLLAGLPVAGVSGTLIEHNRFTDAASKAGAGWVRAKTGSIDVTYALAGYVPDVDGRLLVFALNSNGVTGDPGRYAQDAFATALRSCGCS